MSFSNSLSVKPVLHCDVFRKQFWTGEDFVWHFICVICLHRTSRANEIQSFVIWNRLIWLVADVSSQKPKQKDWHPPDGFILGLWTLILLVFFKTYGIKHLKHIFWFIPPSTVEVKGPTAFIKESTLTLFMIDLVRNRFLFIFWCKFVFFGFFCVSFFESDMPWLLTFKHSLLFGAQ